MSIICLGILLGLSPLEMPGWGCIYSPQHKRSRWRKAAALCDTPDSSVVHQTTHLSAFRPRGVPGPTSKIVAACPSPDGLARDGTQGGKHDSCYPAPGDALVVGVTSVREGERE
jgi:hypothetical protein